MNIGILDNFDSFTFNLRAEFEGASTNIHIWRNTMALEEVTKRIWDLPFPKLLILSPGPGHPKNAGCMMELIDKVKGIIPVFGVCLGMQAIVESFGGKVTKAQEVVHGKARILKHEGKSIFSGLNKRMFVGRYHSLHASMISDDFEILARSDGLIMSISHRRLPIKGVQFHPESILSTDGQILIKNVMAWAGGLHE